MEKCKKTKEMLDKYYRGFVPPYSAIKYWIARFTRGRRNINDEHVQRAPKTMILMIIKIVHDIVLVESKMVCEIAVAIDRWTDSVFSTLQENYI